MRRLIKYSGLFFLLFCAGHCFADFWMPPGARRILSDSNEFMVCIEPAFEPYKHKKPVMKVFRVKNRNVLDVQYFGITLEPEGIIYPSLPERIKQWEDNDDIEFLWKCKLSNKVAPVEVFVSDDGEYVVTQDNWYEAGHGKDVIAFYNRKGQIKKYSLEQMFPDNSNEHMPLLSKISYSVSSRRWTENSIMFFERIEGKLLFCIWLEWDNRWLIYDVSRGKIAKLDDESMEQVNNRAMDICRDNLQSPPRFDDKIITSVLLLAKYRQEEDKELIKPILNHNHFSGGTSSRNNLIIKLFSTNSYRKAADMALSIIDGKYPVETTYRQDRKLKYNYLGYIEGKIVLAEEPEDKSVLSIILVPSNAAENSNSEAESFRTLKYEHNRSDILKYESDGKMDFLFEGVTPGKYRIKALYKTEGGENYQSQKSLVFEVKSGQTTDVGIIECKSKIEE